MSDKALEPSRSLAGAALPVTPEFALALQPETARFILRGGADVAFQAGKAFGVALPLDPCGANAQGDRAALWLGPDEWLLLAEGEDAAALGLEISAGLAGHAHSLVDVSHRQTGLRVEGRNAARALSAGCPLDLHPAAFPIGMATRTLLAKVEIVLWRLETETFHVEVWRSFADYAAGYLSGAARGAPDF